MMDHDLPPGTHAAAVEANRQQAQRRRQREGESHQPQAGDNDHATTQSQQQQCSGSTQQAGQTLFKDWASI
jgi:hypothetical protein